MRKRNYSDNMKNFKNTDLEQWAEEVRKIHYSKLTEHQWDMLRVVWVVNWFGPSSQPILRYILKKIAPSFKVSSAEIHDVVYWQGWDENRRRQCDEWFFMRIFQDAMELKWFLKIYYGVLAVVFFLAVRILGKRHFNYSKCQRSKQYSKW